MSCYPFGKKHKTRSQHRNCRGWTKASTGYIKNSDKKSTQLTAFLETDMTSRGFIKDQILVL
jgi:hypothetical protein